MTYTEIHDREKVHNIQNDNSQIFTLIYTAMKKCILSKTPRLSF